jgi:DNA-directed RNA polymerase specialized sigma24 family protein
MLYPGMGITEIAERTPDDDFSAFADRITAPLLRAMVATFGPDAGREAALDALAWGWEHWERLARMRNPAGYLYRVGLTAGRRAWRRGNRADLQPDVEAAAAHEDRVPDPDLRRAIDGLSARQRAAVVLVVGHGLPLREAAETLGCSISSVRNHVDRALRRLHAELKEGTDG